MHIPTLSRKGEEAVNIQIKEKSPESADQFLFLFSPLSFHLVQYLQSDFCFLISLFLLSLLVLYLLVHEFSSTSRSTNQSLIIVTKGDQEVLMSSEDGWDARLEYNLIFPLEFLS